MKIPKVPPPPTDCRICGDPYCRGDHPHGQYYQRGWEDAWRTIEQHEASSNLAQHLIEKEDA